MMDEFCWSVTCPATVPRDSWAVTERSVNKEIEIIRNSKDVGTIIPGQTILCYEYYHEQRLENDPEHRFCLPAQVRLSRNSSKLTQCAECCVWSGKYWMIC